jgi:PPIC-type PPIASE domain
MRRLAREPLLHFLLLGAVIFVVWGFRSRDDATRPGAIVVTEARIASLATAFDRVWQRPPTTTELDGLIRDYVREEVMGREAMALGLGRDDTIIRRRLRQKLEFVTEDVAALAEPTEEQLRTYLAEYPDTFRAQARFTFSQVHLDPARRGANLARDVARLLAGLEQAGLRADVSALGDSRMLDHQFVGLPTGDVDRQFGEGFAAKLAALAVGRWHGPIESGYGVHLVLVRERTEGRAPTLEDVRDAVRRAWMNARRQEANENFYQALLRRYTVTVERPPAVTGARETGVAEARQ